MTICDGDGGPAAAAAGQAWVLGSPQPMAEGLVTSCVHQEPQGPSPALASTELLSAWRQPAMCQATHILCVDSLARTGRWEATAVVDAVAYSQQMPPSFLCVEKGNADGQGTAGFPR